MNDATVQPIRVRAWVFGEPEQANVYDAAGMVARVSGWSVPGPGPYQARCACGWRMEQIDEYFDARGALYAHERTHSGAGR